MKAVIGVLLLAGVVVGLYYLNEYTRRPDGKSLLNVARELEIQVDAAVPEKGVIVRTVQAPGDVEALAEVDISSELVSKIIELPIVEGQEVHKGDLLCRLDDADYRARVLSAQAAIARLQAMITQADAELEKAEIDYKEEKRLFEIGGTSQEALNRIRTIQTSARAMRQMRTHELSAAEADLQRAQEDLQKTIIRSPLDGIVSQLFAEQGEVVVTGTMNNPGTRIMVISDLSKLQVRCRVDESDAPLVAQGQVARVYLQSDTRRSISAQVERVGTKGTKPVGRDVVTFETLVLITGEDERIKPGMSANVEIEVARHEDVLTVPVEAVVYRKRRDLPEELVRAYDEQQAKLDPTKRQSVAEYIKLIFSIADGKARPLLVQTGINDATRVEVVDGLVADQSVVIGPYRSLDQLKDGAAVKINVKPGAQPGDALAASTQPSATSQPLGPVATSQPAAAVQARAESAP